MPVRQPSGTVGPSLPDRQDPDPVGAAVQASRRTRYVAGVALAVALSYTAFVLLNTVVVGPVTLMPLPWLSEWLYVQDALDIIAAAIMIAAGAAILDRLLVRDQALQSAAAAAEVQRRLLADTSHELRNPLTVLRANLSLLQREDADPQLRLEAARDAEEEAARLARLVDDLLLLARGAAGDLLQRRPVRLDHLLAEMATEAQEAGSDHRIVLTPPPLVTVSGDAERLRQVLRNVVGNALRHTPPGTEVHLSLEADDHTAEIAVTDTGPGIGAEHLPRLFDRFYRVDAARSRSAGSDGASLSGGAGLGLAIVKHLVEAHGGSVRLTSEPDRGTTVRIRLPLSSTD